MIIIHAPNFYCPTARTTNLNIFLAQSKFPSVTSMVTKLTLLKTISPQRGAKLAMKLVVNSQTARNPCIIAASRTF